MHGFDTSIPGGHWVNDDESAKKWLAYFIQSAKEVGSLGLDSETTGLVKHKDTVVVWSLSDGIERICLPAKYLQMYKDSLLENPEINFDFTNAKFDAHMFANTGIDLSKAGEWRDTIVQSWLLNENNQGRHGLKESVREHFGRETPTFEQTFGKIPKKSKANPVVFTTGELISKAFSNPDPEEVLRAADYASLDAYNSTMLRRHFDKLLANNPTIDLCEYYYRLEVPFTKVLWKMERRGITADYGFLKELQGPMEVEMLRIEKEFAKEAGRPINLGSTFDTRWFFLEHLQKKPIKMTKGGKTGNKRPSTDGEVLEKWASSGDPWAKLLLTHRGISKIYGTYVVSLQQWIDHRYRIHTTLNQHGTVTGRLSSVDPNLQNLPRTSEDIFKIREAFIAGEGMCLIVADYAQLEMRLMAHFSGDEKMIQAIRNGIDLHCLTVSEMHGIPYDDCIGAVTAEKKHKKGTLGRELTEREHELLFMRQAAKATGFGIIYGIGGAKLANGLSALGTRVVTEDEGFQLIEKWFNVFPGVRAYINSTHAQLKSKNFVQTITGRFRRFGDIKGMSFRDKGQVERQGVNSVIQGSAADIAKVVMILAESDPIMRELGASLLLQIHDELIWECPDIPEVIAAVKKRAREIMESPFDTPLQVPLPADINHGYSWATAK